MILNISRNEFYYKELELVVSKSYGPGRYDKQYEVLGNDYPIEYVRWTENRNFEAFLNICVISVTFEVSQLLIS